MIKQIGNSARRDNSPPSSRDAIRSVEVNSVVDSIFLRSGQVKTTAAMASTATAATARRHIYVFQLNDATDASRRAAFTPNTCVVAPPASLTNERGRIFRQFFYMRMFKLWPGIVSVQSTRRSRRSPAWSQYLQHVLLRRFDCRHSRQQANSRRCQHAGSTKPARWRHTRCSHTRCLRAHC